MLGIRRIIALSVLSVLGVFPATAQEGPQGIFRIPSGDRIEVDRHHVCKVLHNTRNDDVMVSTGVPSEWMRGDYAFLTVTVPGVNVLPCGPEALCPVPDRSYSITRTLASDAHGQISPDGSTFITVPSSAGTETEIQIWSRSGNSWSRAQTLKVQHSGGIRVFGKGYGSTIAISEAADRAIMIAYVHDENPDTARMIELSKRSNGKWSVEEKSFPTGRPLPANNVKFVGSSLDTAVLAWNNGDEEAPSAVVLNRNASGNWRIESRLPRPSRMIYPLDVWISDGGERAFMTATAATGGSGNNFYPNLAIDYRKVNGQWEIERTHGGASLGPASASSNGLMGVAVSHDGRDGDGKLTNAELLLYSRNSPGENFQIIDRLPINKGDCCMAPVMSADGTTIAALEVKWLAPAKTFVFNVVNDRLVRRGAPIPAQHDYMKDWPRVSATGDVVFNQNVAAHACNLN